MKFIIFSNKDYKIGSTVSIAVLLQERKLDFANMNLSNANVSEDETAYVFRQKKDSITDYICEAIVEEYLLHERYVRDIVINNILSKDYVLTGDYLLALYGYRDEASSIDSVDFFYNQYISLPIDIDTDDLTCLESMSGSLIKLIDYCGTKYRLTPYTPSCNYNIIEGKCYANPMELLNTKIKDAVMQNKSQDVVLEIAERISLINKIDVTKLLHTTKEIDINRQKPF